MTSPGEGWYRDPQDAGMLRWWTGTAWTHHTAPVPSTYTYGFHPPLPRWWGAVAVAVQVCLGLCVAAAAFSFWVDQQVLAFVDDVRLRPDLVTQDQGERVDRLLLMTSAELLLLVATGVLFISWLYTAHNSSRMHRQALKRSSGWAIGGWFVPVLSLWRPFQMVTDVRRGATDRSWLGASLLQGWWWATWVGKGFADGATAALYSRVTRTAVDDPGATADALAAAASWERFSNVVTIASAVFAILLVRQVTKLVKAPRETPSGA